METTSEVAERSTSDKERCGETLVGITNTVVGSRFQLRFFFSSDLKMAQITGSTPWCQMSARSPPLPLPQELLVSKPPIVSPRTVYDDDSGVDTQWLKKELWMLLQTTTLLASSSARRPDLEVVWQYLPIFAGLTLLALMLGLFARQVLVNHKLQKCLDYVHECHSASCPGQSAEPGPRVAESATSVFLGATTSRSDNATGRGEASSWTDTVEFGFIGTPEQLDDSTTSSSTTTTDGADEQQVHKIHFSSRSPSLPRSSESPVGLSPRSEANHQHFASHETTFCHRSPSRLPPVTMTLTADPQSPRNLLRQTFARSLATMAQSEAGPPMQGETGAEEADLSRIVVSGEEESSGQRHAARGTPPASPLKSSSHLVPYTPRKKQDDANLISYRARKYDPETAAMYTRGRVYNPAIAEAFKRLEHVEASFPTGGAVDEGGGDVGVLSALLQEMVNQMAHAVRPRSPKRTPVSGLCDV